MATTVRVKEATRERAAAIARETGVSIGEVVERALEAYETERFWEQTRQALSGAADRPDSAWDAVDRDGLDRD